MIKCHVSRLMGEHKLRVKDVAEATGMHRNAVTLLYRESAVRIEISAINELCKLFQCDVADLFEYRPDEVLESKTAKSMATKRAVRPKRRKT